MYILKEIYLGLRVGNLIIQLKKKNDYLIRVLKLGDYCLKCSTKYTKRKKVNNKCIVLKSQK